MHFSKRVYSMKSKSFKFFELVKNSKLNLALLPWHSSFGTPISTKKSHNWNRKLPVRSWNNVLLVVKQGTTMFWLYYSDFLATQRSNAIGKV